MQERIYNNPLFASGLARLVESYMPDPSKQADLEYKASLAALNRQSLAQKQQQMGGLGDIVGRPPAPAPKRGPSEAERNRALRAVKNAGIAEADESAVVNAIIQTYNTGSFGTLDEAAAVVLPQVKYSDPVIEPNRLFDGEGSVWSDLFSGKEVITPPQLVLPPVGAPAAPVAPPSDGIPVVNSPEEAMKLPSGTVFKTPDGTIRKVP